MIIEIARNGGVSRPTVLTEALTVFLWLGVAVPVRSAPVQEMAAGRVSETKPARKCMSNLQAFNAQIRKDGYWLYTADYGYGYPMFGVNYPYAGTVLGGAESGTSAFVRARPGYDVRTLIAAANILALRGQPQACEVLVNATRGIYQEYLADLRRAKVTKEAVSVWRGQLIAGAMPVSPDTTGIKFDDLIGIDVVNSHNVGLGSVEDVLLDRKTRQIAYLVIGRGGVFGIDEKYVPVPWTEFKIASDRVLLLLNTSQADMESAPQLAEQMFESSINFSPDNKKVDAYWKAHVSP